MTYIHFIGIDISKNTFDAVCHDTPHRARHYANTSQGHAALLQDLAGRLPEALVVLEATGGYEAALIAALLAAGVAVHRATPLQAKHFLRSLRLAGKTDRLDAAALARYGAERHAGLSLCHVASAEMTALQDCLVRRADLVAMRVAEQNRLQHPRYAGLKASVQAVLKTLTRQIDALEARMEGLIAQSPALTAKMDVLTSVEGVGKQTAYTLLAALPELGRLTRRQAASLAGLAPHPRDSGSLRGARRATGGRAAVKRALFMAAMAARRFNPALRTFYQRLILNGKKKMVALTAVMRKLITILNAKLRDAALAHEHGR